MQLVVQDVADVGLVDPEAEGAGRDHHGAMPAPHELGLLGIAVLGRHPPVIVVRRHAESTQQRVDDVDLAASRTVHDARATQAARQTDENAPPDVLVAAQNLEREIRAVRRAGHHAGLAHAERAHDRAAHPGCGGRREGQQRRLAERAQTRPHPQVGGAKVVPPLGQTMRLVDRDEPHAGFGEGLARVHGVEGLGRGHDQ
jgi:hypothetical protein